MQRVHFITDLPDLRLELVKEFGSLAFEYNKPAILSALAQRSTYTAPSAQEGVLAAEAITPPNTAIEAGAADAGNGAGRGNAAIVNRGSAVGDVDSDDDLPPLPEDQAEGDEVTFSGNAGAPATLSAAVTAATAAATPPRGARRAESGGGGGAAAGGDDPAEEQAGVVRRSVKKIHATRECTRESPTGISAKRKTVLVAVQPCAC